MKDFNELLSRHPRKGNKWISYGTAGFRDKLQFTHICQQIKTNAKCFRATELQHIMFRMGILATLRARVVR
ncbi:unnamed protein product, partial [Oppiella nova]